MRSPCGVHGPEAEAGLLIPFRGADGAIEAWHGDRETPRIGLRRHTVRLVAHEPEWRALFAAEADAIRSHLGDNAVDVQHVGSTAVADLVAKPILNIAVAVSTPDAVRLAAERLRDAGYLDRGSGGAMEATCS